MKNQAISVNASFVNNNDEVNGGLHLTTSDGVDITSEVSGSNLEDVLEDLLFDVMAQMVEPSKEEEEEELDSDEKSVYLNVISDLEDRNYELEREIAALKKRLDYNKVNNIMADSVDKINKYIDALKKYYY